MNSAVQSRGAIHCLPSVCPLFPGLKLCSDLERLRGIVVHGDAWEPGEYTVKDSEIELSGFGCSDFTARGAGATVFGGGTLNLENLTITTRVPTAVPPLQHRMPL